MRPPLVRAAPLARAALAALLLAAPLAAALVPGPSHLDGSPGARPHR